MKILIASQNRRINQCPLHSHSCYELVVVASGECITEINSAMYRMKKGAVLIIPPNVEHREYSDSCYSDIFIKFDICDIPMELPLFFVDYSYTILRLADIIKNLFIKNNFENLELCSDLMRSVLLYISSAVKESYSHSLVPKLKNILVENLSNADFNMKKAISDLGYNLDYAARIFKKNIGMSPHKYLTHIRIEQAKRLLFNNDYYTAKQVSFLCGFSDQYYFSRAFKQITGATPKEYRLRCKNRKS